MSSLSDAQMAQVARKQAWNEGYSFGREEMRYEMTVARVAGAPALPWSPHPTPFESARLDEAGWYYHMSKGESGAYEKA